MKKAFLIVCSGIILSTPIMAADTNKTVLQGRVLSIKKHVLGSEVFRVDVQLFTQVPAGGPYSPFFTCSPLIWDDCTATNLIPGCTTTCSTTSGPDSTTIESCQCPTFNPGAGVCLMARPFHDGLVLLSDQITVLSNTSCTAVP